jgi:hypothetical protein
VDDTGRKRRKVTHISTVPLANVPHKLPEALIASAADTSGQALTDGDEFSHLLRWQDAEDEEEVLDLAADDDIEDDENYSLGDTAEEDQRDIPDDSDGGAPGPSHRTKLTADAIAEIINERIEFYHHAWKLNKGVAREDEINEDEDVIWAEAEALGKRLELAQKYEAEHAYLSYRLDRLCEEILMYHSAGSNAVSKHLQPKPTW